MAASKQDIPSASGIERGGRTTPCRGSTPTTLASSTRTESRSLASPDSSIFAEKRAGLRKDLLFTSSSEQGLIPRRAATFTPVDEAPTTRTQDRSLASPDSSIFAEKRAGLRKDLLFTSSSEQGLIPRRAATFTPVDEAPTTRTQNKSLASPDSSIFAEKRAGLRKDLLFTSSSEQGLIPRRAATFTPVDEAPTTRTQNRSLASPDSSIFAEKRAGLRKDLLFTSSSEQGLIPRRAATFTPVDEAPTTRTQNRSLASPDSSIFAEKRAGLRKDLLFTSSSEQGLIPRRAATFTPVDEAPTTRTQDRSLASPDSSIFAEKRAGLRKDLLFTSSSEQGLIPRRAATFTPVDEAPTTRTQNRSLASPDSSIFAEKRAGLRKDLLFTSSSEQGLIPRRAATFTPVDEAPTTRTQDRSLASPDSSIFAEKRAGLRKDLLFTSSSEQGLIPRRAATFTPVDEAPTTRTQDRCLAAPDSSTIPKKRVVLKQNLPPDREQSEKQLQQYILDTFTCIKTVQDFCDREQTWTSQRTSEIQKIRDIKSHVQSKNKKLEKELAAVLTGTLEGLKKLQRFLDALEKLAVTSLFVFTDEVFLMKGVSARAVRSVISTARTVSPLLILFKRDANAFFLPCLDNIDVLDFQLIKYICNTEQLCKTMRYEETLEFIGIPTLNMTGSMPDMSDHLSQLSKIRMDESFRLTFLFNGKAEEFIDVYSECRTRMAQFLTSLQETAEKLDKLKMGSRISSVAGSSVSAVGGVLSITGLALTPVTAGVSLILTLTGVGMGVVSGVSSVITHISAMKMNKKHGKKANNIFERFKEDLDMIQECLEQIGNSKCPAPRMAEVNVALGAVKVMATTTMVAKGIRSMVKKGQALNAINTGQVGNKLACMALNETRVAQNIAKASAQVTKVGAIAVNVLFIGIDLKTIYNECKNLHKGKKTKASQFIFSRSALWRSEVEALEKIHDCLCEGKETFQRNLTILDQPVYR